MTDAAEQLRRAAIVWAHHLRSTGQAVPDGYAEALDRLLDTANQDPEWLTVTEAAARARVSPRTIRRWRSRGLASARVGSVTLVRTSDLDEFLAHGGHPRDGDHPT